MEEPKLCLQEACKRRYSRVLSTVEELLLQHDNIKSDISITDRLKQSCQEIVKDVKKPLLIGIDGMCASGKTTLGYYIQQHLGGNLFHMDDFFLQNSQRTKERLSEIGGNIDYERFHEEVLKPILEQDSVYYRPFDCAVRELKEGWIIPYQRLNIIEGSYSLHPYFGDVYDLKLFLTIEKEKQLERICLRNGEEMLKRFKSEWIPKENTYFEAFQVAKGCIQISWEYI